MGSLPRVFTADLTGEGLPRLWSVVADPEAADGRALEQRTPDPTDHRFPLAIYEPVVAQDVEANIRFKTVYGKVD